MRALSAPICVFVVLLNQASRYLLQTGLDVETDTILQVACIITDGSLQQVVEGEEITVHHDEEVLARMNPWCVENHGRSGLTQAVRDSAVSMAEAEQRVLAFVQSHVPDSSCAQIAGNSVHVDVAFLRRWMPKVVDYLHYRIVDVSTVGEREFRHGAEVEDAPQNTLRSTAATHQLGCRLFSDGSCAHLGVACSEACADPRRPPCCCSVPALVSREYGKSPRKRQAHTAMSDIRESIDQLRYYRKAVFKPSR